MKTVAETPAPRPAGTAPPARPPAEALAAFLRAEWPLVALGVATVALQLGVFLNVTPNVFPDSHAYQLLADAVARGDWGYTGFTFRTPGYPVIMAWSNALFGHGNWHAIMVLQFLCGTAVPFLLYYLFLPVTGSRGGAALAGAAFLLDRYSVGLQTVPLTEFMGGFTVIAALAAWLWGVGEKRWWGAVLVGVIFYINLIIRPSYSLLFWCVAFGGLAVEMCYPAGRAAWRRTLGWYALFCLTVQIGVWGWSLVVYRNTGVFGLSHQVGASMLNHTGTMLDSAPDEFANIRDRFKRELAVQKGNHINLFDQRGWKVAEETSMTMWQLSLELKKMNRAILLRNPGKYAGQVGYAWNKLWGDNSRYITDITDPDGSRTGRFDLTPFVRLCYTNPVLRVFYVPLDNALWLSPAVLRFMPLLLAALTGAVLFIRRRDCRAVLATAAVAGTVVYHMLLHAMVQMTEFGRYKLPIQPLWFSLLIATLWVVVAVAWKAVRGDAAPSRVRPRRDAQDSPTRSRRDRRER